MRGEGLREADHGYGGQQQLHGGPGADGACGGGGGRHVALLALPEPSLDTRGRVSEVGEWACEGACEDREHFGSWRRPRF